MFKEKESQVRLKLFNLFEDKGIVLDLSQLTNLISPESSKFNKEINAIVEEAFKTRKLNQFFDSPVLSDIQDNQEIADDVIKAINDKNHRIRGPLFKYNQDVTPKQLTNYVKNMLKKDKGEKVNWIVYPIIAIVVVVIAFCIYYFIN